MCLLYKYILCLCFYQIVLHVQHLTAGIQCGDPVDRERLQGDDEDGPGAGKGELPGDGHRDAAVAQHTEGGARQAAQGDSREVCGVFNFKNYVTLRCR